MKGDRLVGTKAILRYLEVRHDVVICRETLYRLRTSPQREFSCSDIAAGAEKFPAGSEFDGITVSIIADSSDIDAWIARHRRVRRSADEAPDKAHVA